MVDFAKFAKDPPKRIIVTYRCAKCGKVEDYILELPVHIRQHITGLRPECRGKLIEVARRDDVEER